MKKYFKRHTTRWTTLWVWTVVLISAEDDDDAYDTPIYTYDELVEYFNEYKDFKFNPTYSLSSTQTSLISCTTSPSIGYGELYLNRHQFLLKL